MTEIDRNQQRQELMAIQEILKQQKDLFKPMFGLMFWQLAATERHLSLEEIRNESLSLTMSQENDEALGVLFGIYLQIWDSANDFNAASRFIASTLDLSADELLQSKIIYDNQLN